MWVGVLSIGGPEVGQTYGHSWAEVVVVRRECKRMGEEEEEEEERRWVTYSRVLTSSSPRHCTEGGERPSHNDAAHRER